MVFMLAALPPAEYYRLIVSRETSYRPPNVPDELQYLQDEPAQTALHERWQDYDLDGVMARMPELTEAGGTRLAVLRPEGAEVDTGTVLVMGMSYLQSLTPYQYIRAEYARQAVAPDSTMYVFPNNNASEQNFSFSDSDRERLRTGLLPIAEHQTRALEALGVCGDDVDVYLQGYSQAGQVALHMAGVAMSDIKLSIISADEAPSVRRTLTQLRRDFGRSGGLLAELGAIRDAAMPAFSEAHPLSGLLLGYAKFLNASRQPDAKAIAHGMAAVDFDSLVAQARRGHPERFIKLGQVAGSHLFDRWSMTPDTRMPSIDGQAGLSIVEYSGAGARQHATGVNPVANALMFKHAVDLAAATKE